MNEVTKKIKNLRSTYNQELLKIEKSKKSGSGTDEIYKPSIKWFDSMDYIMKIINLKEKETSSNLEPYHPSTSGSNVASASGSEEATNNVDLDASDNSNKAAHIKVVKPPKTVKLKTKLSSERSDIQAAVNELKELNSSLVNVSAPITRELEDECDVIGRHVALQLKQLSSIDRIDATDEIQAILSRYRKRALCGRIVYTPSNYSSECTPSPQPTVNYEMSALSMQVEQSSQSILHNECTLSPQPVSYQVVEVATEANQPVEPTTSAFSAPLLDQFESIPQSNDVLAAAISICNIKK
ncbi:uncharacterized protein LOC113508093 [Trichoplusia ni]|nr:uncharacterized protein LOC113508093 [Trichoplusia ni]